MKNMDSYKMTKLSTHSLEIIYTYLLESLREDENQNVSLFDSELGDYASECATLQVAAFLAYLHHEGIAPLGSVQARGLMFDVMQRRSNDDWFSIPYNAPIGSSGQRDLAEFGAAAKSVGYLAEKLDPSAGCSLLAEMASKLEVFEVDELVGAYRKNDSASKFDVLNGDLYAALVLGVAYSATGIASFHIKMCAVIRHLISRFNPSTNQWPYSELWNGDQYVGMSVSYQATITGWGRNLLSILPTGLAAEWRSVLTKAENEIVDQIKIGRSDTNEMTSWVNPWDQVWEIWQSLHWVDNSSIASNWVDKNIVDIDDNFTVRGIKCMSDLRPKHPQRTIPGSTLRKTANFISIYQNMIC